MQGSASSLSDMHASSAKHPSPFRVTEEPAECVRVRIVSYLTKSVPPIPSSVPLDASFKSSNRSAASLNSSSQLPSPKIATTQKGKSASIAMESTLVMRQVYWVGLAGVTINHALDSDWLSSVMAIFTAPQVRTTSF